MIINKDNGNVVINNIIRYRFIINDVLSGK